ncbi:response regulator transcription factor [Candidatus Contubernalis alkaliaceticus]|uniref:response regulator transcription factor n=1 Tax=Candidatus Contubernalis alkaliaceticus TaxID=338645 RepID=UPI001F4C3EC3|nr:response regulator transcription factor [Candidatus Contubernalis alkalaceticus]UNC92084.1 response regulator transcription factor [Candidatus Contubernalis alkalaceticus]
MSNEKILIVDDEVELAEILRDYLNQEGFKTCLAFNGEEALEQFHKFQPQLVILDIMMPNIDGMEVCRIIRSKSNIPILMLSSKSTDIDKILGLGLGADDYITKPFSPTEVVARVKAQLRRFMHLSNVYKDSPLHKIGNLIINSSSYSVHVKNSKVELAAKEFELLNYLAQHPKQVFNREQLYNQIWGYDEFGDINTITVHIRKIREKIEEDPSRPKYIKTVWGVGYKFDFDEEE